MLLTEPTLAQARALLAAVEKRCGASDATRDASGLIAEAEAIVEVVNQTDIPMPSFYACKAPSLRSAIAVLRCAVIDWWYLPTTECDQRGADVCDAAERNNIPALIAALEAKDAT